jgi:hypothetical protein
MMQSSLVVPSRQPRKYVECCLLSFLGTEVHQKPKTLILIEVNLVGFVRPYDKDEHTNVQKEISNIEHKVFLHLVGLSRT